MIMSFRPTSFTEDNNNSKKSTSLEQNKENTHTGSLKKCKIKRVGGYFCLQLFCAIGSSFLSAKLRLKEYLKSGCDVQWRYVSALGKGNRAVGVFEVACEEWTGLYTYNEL